MVQEYIIRFGLFFTGYSGYFNENLDIVRRFKIIIKNRTQMPYDTQGSFKNGSVFKNVTAWIMEHNFKESVHNSHTPIPSSTK